MAWKNYKEVFRKILVDFIKNIYSTKEVPIVVANCVLYERFQSEEKIGELIWKKRREG